MKPIITLEDGTEIIETTGDVDAFEHGGGVLFREPRRKQCYWQFWRGREEAEKNYTVFTAPIPEKVIEFFEADLKELAKYSDLEPQTIRRLSRSKDPKERLQVVVAMRDVHGPSAIDPGEEPEILTPRDLSERWGDVFGKDLGEIPEVDYEDYVIRDAPQGGYECGCIDATYLGRFEIYKHALCAIAEHMRDVGTDANVMYEHGPGQLELVIWDHTEFLDKDHEPIAKRNQVRWRTYVRQFTDEQRRAQTIAKRNQRQKSIMKKRSRRKKKLAQKDRIARARTFRKSMEEIYG